MRINEEQLAAGFRACRESRIKNIDEAALLMGMGSTGLTKRETGTYSIKLIELLSLSYATETHPVTLLWEILTHCDQQIWQAAADKMGCSPAQARDRLERAAGRMKITPWQVWLKVEKDQLTL